MNIEVITCLDEIAPEAWNRLHGVTDNPFLRHEFLAGMERFDCVGEKWGWHPQHLVIRNADEVMGALPLYLKDNSYGELVFDWNWAEAYQRSGGRYYPKLVSAVPYSPVTGPRLLTAPGSDRKVITDRLITAAIDLAQSRQLSSWHVLFPEEAELDQLLGHKLLLRSDTQYHWHNRDYASFDDFLATFNAQRRKKLKRERRRVQEADITVEVLDGHKATAEHWQHFYRFYRNTFDRKSGWATLSEGFFRWLGESMPDSVVLMLASHGGRYVAGALSLRSADTLYGRHWGCDEEFHSLHFELCYYQGIDYCIEHGLQHFQPGAQGEHKVWRGFEPTATWSAHWLREPAFAEAVERYLEHEREAVAEHREMLGEHLPYKKPAG